MESYSNAIGGQNVYTTSFDPNNFIPAPFDDTDMPCLGLKRKQVDADWAAMTAEQPPVTTERSDTPTGLKTEHLSQASTPAKGVPELTPDHEHHEEQAPSSGLFIKQAPLSSPPVAQNFRSYSHLSSATPAPNFNPGSRADPIDIDEIPSPATKVPSLPPKSRKGRSHGPKSTKHIREMRAQAENGNIDAALKLGWSVERLTIIFNQAKAARTGMLVNPKQPIDDPELLARIELRKEHGREASKRRADKLKARVAEGDIEAAKKLKLSDKTMNTLFPNLTSLVPLSEESEREDSPTEPFNSQQEAKRKGIYRHQSISTMADRYGMHRAQIPKPVPGPSQQPQNEHNGVSKSSKIQYASNTAAQPVPMSMQVAHASQRPIHQANSNSSWGTMRSCGQMYQMPPPPAFQMEVQLLTARDVWRRMAVEANQRAQYFENSLKQYQKQRGNMGVAAFDAMQNAKVNGGCGTQAKVANWTWVHETGMENEMMVE